MLWSWSKPKINWADLNVWQKVTDFQCYLTESVYNVVQQKSVPAQIREHIPQIGDNTGYVDRFVEELTFSKRLYKHFFEMR